jgi:undecaprenyl-diphosphatase
VAGDVTSFLLGRRLGRAFLVKHGPKVQITPERLVQVESFFERHGGAAVLLGRFVGIVRAVAPFLAGSGGMPLRRFLPYDILGAGLWGTTYCLLGYAFWRSLGTVLDVAEQGALALGTVIVVVVGIGWGSRFLGDEANRRRVWAWLERQERRPVAGRLWRPAVRGLRRAVPALRFLAKRLTPGGLGLEFTTLLAIAAVGAFALVGYAITLSVPTELTAGDLRGLRWGRQVESGRLTDLSQVVTELGALPVAGTALVLAAIGLLARRQALEALSLTAGLVLTIVLVEVVQGMEGRVAPPDPLASLDDAASFPSGHAAYGVGWIAIALALRRALPNLPSRAVLLIGSILLALAIAASRVGLRLAWFSDAAGGLAAGALGFSVATGIALVVASVRHNGARTREQ